MKTIKVLICMFLLSISGAGLEVAAETTTVGNTVTNVYPQKKKTSKKKGSSKKNLGRCHCIECGGGRCKRQATVRHGGWKLCRKCNQGPYGSGCFYYCDGDCC